MDTGRNPDSANGCAAIKKAGRGESAAGIQRPGERSLFQLHPIGHRPEDIHA